MKKMMMKKEKMVHIFTYCGGMYRTQTLILGESIHKPYNSLYNIGF
mgnify:CR=1 FL=1